MGWDSVHLVLQPLFGLLYQAQMMDDDCGAIGGMQIGSACLSATLATTNPAWPDLASNLGHCSGKLATNRLSYGTALHSTK
jgi:hypothetical protein